MKLIYICSPLRGNIQENIRKANEYCRQIAEAGNIPFASHTVFTQFLNDDNPSERQLGIDLGLEMLKRCDALLVCGMILSEGMKQEIKEAHSLGIPVQYSNMKTEDIDMTCTGTEFLQNDELSALNNIT